MTRCTRLARDVLAVTIALGGVACWCVAVPLWALAAVACDVSLTLAEDPPEDGR